MDLILKEKVNACLEAKKQSKVSIVLDWLSLYFNQKDIFCKEYEPGDTVKVNDDLYLVWIDQPTLHFLTHFVIVYKKEECGHLLCNSRNEKFFPKEVVKVDFANHTLYSGQWFELYEQLQQWHLVYRSASRIDIAIDGVQYLYELMNIYAKQNPDNRTISLKNSSQSRAIFSAKVLDTKSMNFQNFNIGSSGGNKMVTIYNKSLELIKSGKDYIQDYWLKNGVIDTKNDLEKAAKKLSKNEIVGKGSEDIYRFELRLKSEAIRVIEGFRPEILTTGQGLAGIVKTHTSKYFDMYWNDNENVSRCTGIEILPLEKLEAININKVERQQTGGMYKAKLSIHLTIENIHKGYSYLQKYAYNEAIEMIFQNVEAYRLSDYLRDKLPEWKRDYRYLIDDDRLNEVIFVLAEIEKQNALYQSSDSELASRHDQADATANFGEDYPYF